MLSAEAMVRGYHSIRRLGMHLLKILSCEREVGNIHTFAVRTPSGIKMVNKIIANNKNT